MTSIPASRSARAMILAPRSCPSRPGFATTTRIFPATGVSIGTKLRLASMTDPATLVGLLADEHRLRVFAAVALGARTVDEIAERSGLDATEVQAGLPRLVGARLVTQAKGFQVSLDALRAAALLRPERERGAADATPDEQRVLRNFVVDGRLVRLPARHAQKQVVLGYVARRFDESRSYEE